MSNMLGEVLSETKGKIPSQRVLSAEGPKLEASFTSVGKLKGIDITEMATFWSMPRPGRALFGKGDGVMMTVDGEDVSWSGSGIGKFGQGAWCSGGARCICKHHPPENWLRSITS